jgi:aspartate/tyrosine/aromatic aminotransferase
MPQQFYMLRHSANAKWQLVIAGSLAKAQALYEKRLGRDAFWELPSSCTHAGPFPVTKDNWDRAKRLQALDCSHINEREITGEWL